MCRKITPYLIILLLWSKADACAQVSDDSLKSICVTLYRNDVALNGNAWLKHQLAQDNLTANVSELFKNVFQRLSVCGANYRLVREQYIVDDDFNTYPAIYLVDKATGGDIHFKGPEEFNELMLTREGAEISNVDRSLLYLLSQGVRSEEIIKGIYPERIIRNSVVTHFFASEELCGICPDPQTEISKELLRADANNSGQQNIRIYLRGQGSSKNEVNRISFRFKGKGYLVSVTKIRLAAPAKEK